MSSLSLSLPKIHMVEASKCFSSITEAFVLYSFLTQLCVCVCNTARPVYLEPNIFCCMFYEIP